MSISLSISFINIKNNNGPNIDPCRTEIKEFRNLFIYHLLQIASYILNNFQCNPPYSYITQFFNNIL